MKRSARKKHTGFPRKAPSPEGGRGKRADAQKQEALPPLDAGKVPAAPEVPAPQPSPSPAPAPKRKAFQVNSGLIAGVTASLKHFGLGKQRGEIIENLATMLNAGLPLVDSLKTLEAETRIRAAKAIIRRMTDSVENGMPFWRAMQEERFFAPDAIALVRIGEEGGNLAENMAYLASQQEKDQALRSKITMAMIYPSIVLALMFVVVIGLGMFVLPNLVSVLLSLNVELPFITRVVIKFTDFFTTYGTVAVPSAIVGLLILVALVKFTPLQVVFQWIVFAIPGIGRLLFEATVARFGVIVGGLLRAGVSLPEALRSLTEVTTIARYRKFYGALAEHITVGDSFAKSFSLIRGSSKLLPISVQQLIMTGERTGSLSKIMMKVAEIYEKKANDTAQKLPVILEPMLLLLIAAMVGAIAISIVMPIYSVVGNVTNG